MPCTFCDSLHIDGHSTPHNTPHTTPAYSHRSHIPMDKLVDVMGGESLAVCARALIALTMATLITLQDEALLGTKFNPMAPLHWVLYRVLNIPISPVADTAGVSTKKEKGE